MPSCIMPFTIKVRHAAIKIDLLHNLEKDQLSISS